MRRLWIFCISFYCITQADPLIRMLSACIPLLFRIQYQLRTWGTRRTTIGHRCHLDAIGSSRYQIRRLSSRFLAGRTLNGDPRRRHVRPLGLNWFPYEEMEHMDLNSTSIVVYRENVGGGINQCIIVDGNPESRRPVAPWYYSSMSQGLAVNGPWLMLL